MHYEESRNAVPMMQRTKHLCYRDQPVSVVQWNCCCLLGKLYEIHTHMRARARTHTRIRARARTHTHTHTLCTKCSIQEWCSMLHVGTTVL